MGYVAGVQRVVGNEGGVGFYGLAGALGVFWLDVGGVAEECKDDGHSFEAFRVGGSVARGCGGAQAGFELMRAVGVEAGAGGGEEGDCGGGGGGG